MQPARPASLRKALLGADLTDQHIRGARGGVALRDIVQGWSLGADRLAVSGRSALVVTDHQLTAALALIDLDGLARRIVVAPPDLHREHLAAIIADAEVDTIVTDSDPATFAGVAAIIVAATAAGCWLPARRATRVDPAVALRDE